MMTLIFRSIAATILLALILCGAYPLVVTVLAKAFFPDKASGGIIVLKDGKVVGARLIGQAFGKPEYFHGRPSAAGNSGYDAANSTGSNLGPTNQKLADTLKSNVEQVLKDNPGLSKGGVPTDLVTASASGLDPHITPEGAYVQIARVAKARGVPEEAVRTLVRDHVEGPQLGLFGEPVVNVLLLNLDLDRLYAMNR